MESTRKPYTPPTLTEHGDIVEKTKGFHTVSWESIGYAASPPPPVWED